MIILLRNIIVKLLGILLALFVAVTAMLAFLYINKLIFGFEYAMWALLSELFLLLIALIIGEEIHSYILKKRDERIYREHYNKTLP